MKEKIVAVVIGFALFLILFSITYSYFVNSNNNHQNEEMSVQTSIAALIFSDGIDSFQGNLNFGESVTKSFTIENTGDLDVIVNMVFEDLTNTYLEGSLTYTLNYSTIQDGEYTPLVIDKNIPRSEISTKELLAEKLSIPSKATYYYKLVITLNYLESIDQTSDLNAYFSTHFKLEEESKTTTIVFDYNDENTEETNREILLTSTIGDLPIPTREDYTFLGWFTESEGGTKIDSSTIVNTITSKRVYAHWEMKNKINIILKKLGKKVKSGNPTFANQATTDETKDGLYSLPDDYGTSYYYRGDVQDNYVKFGIWDENTPDVYYGQYSSTNSTVMQYSNLSACQTGIDNKWNYNCAKISKAGKPMYWRIIRINGDGSVRLLYDGTEPHQNSDKSSDRVAWASQVFNTNADDAKYVGYMYGPIGTTASTSKSQAQTNTANSNIKTKLEEWYANNIAKNLDKFVADSIFCNDRSIPGKKLSNWEYDTGLGYATNATAYGATSRVGGPWRTDITEPQLLCSNKNDAFTKSDTKKGNAKLNQKVGLLSADEAVIAGTGKYGSSINTTNFLYKKSPYWSMSPYHAGKIFYAGDGSVAVCFISNGSLGGQNINSLNSSVVPVINLTPEYFNTLIGDGSITSPFRLSTE